MRAPKVAEIVAARIRKQIVRGELKEADALPSETALLTQFGISRPTLREAFRILESEALISVRRGAHGGARVHVPSLDVAARYAALVLQFRGVTLSDVYDARMILEAPAAGLLAARRDRTAALKPLQASIDAAEAAIDDVDTLAMEGQRFHQLVVDGAENQTLVVLTRMLEHIHNVARLSYGSRVGEQPVLRGARRAHRDHIKLVELIRKGKSQEAEEFWRKHLTAVKSVLLSETSAKRVVDLLS